MCELGSIYCILVYIHVDRPDLKSRRWTSADKKQSRINSNNTEGPFSPKKPNQSSSVPALPALGVDMGSRSVTSEGNEYTHSSLPKGSNYAAIDVTQTDYIAVYTPLNA